MSYDPEAHAPNIRHADSALEAVDGADVLLIATEWPEFAKVDFDEVAARMRGHRIVDARNLLDPGSAGRRSRLLGPGTAQRLANTYRRLPVAPDR